MYPKLPSILNTKSLLITGGAGSIGRAFVLALFLTANKRHYLHTLSTWSVWGWFFGLLGARVALPHVASLLFLPSGGVAMSLANSNGRITIWEQVLSAIFQAPRLGYGWNQTFRAQTVGALIHPNEITYT
jgi:O-antigen ligase